MHQHRLQKYPYCKIDRYMQQSVEEKSEDKKKNGDRRNKENEAKAIDTTNYIHIKCPNEPKFKTVFDVSSEDFKPRETTFRVQKKYSLMIGCEEVAPSPNI
eukprot:5160733-Ditylum_brightwellii.AAC.1